MSRVQLALNVSNLEEAITFYSKLFGAEPAKVREGYANFAIVDPPLKLVLIEGGQGGSINHLGVEVETTAAVAAATQRLADEGLGTESNKKQRVVLRYKTKYGCVDQIMSVGRFTRSSVTRRVSLEMKAAVRRK